MVDTDVFHHLVPDFKNRVQRGHRVLKDHGDVFPAEGKQLLLVQVQDVLFTKVDGPIHNLADFRQQADDGGGCHALSAAGFSHDAQDFARRDGKADTVHRLNNAACQVEIGFQIFYGQQR